MRAIDADAMIDRLKEWDTKDKIDKALYNFTLNRINEQPTIQPAQPERIRSKWALRTYMPHNKFCLACRNDSPYNKRWDFCPNCGAEMEVTA